MEFTVHLSGSPPDMLRVPWRTSKFTGAAGVTPSSGMRTFAAGATGSDLTQNFGIRINFDDAQGAGASGELQVDLGPLAGDGAYAFNVRQLEPDDAITVDGLSVAGSATVAINFVDDGVRLSAASLAVDEGDATGASYTARLFTIISVQFLLGGGYSPLLEAS